MTFRFDKLTVKAQEAVQAAQAVAQEQGHPEIDTLHLLSALISESEGVVGPLFDKVGVNHEQLRSMIQSERLSSLGGAVASVAHELNNTLLGGVG